MTLRREFLKEQVNILKLKIYESFSIVLKPYLAHFFNSVSHIWRPFLVQGTGIIPDIFLFSAQLVYGVVISAFFFSLKKREHFLRYIL